MTIRTAVALHELFIGRSGDATFLTYNDGSPFDTTSFSRFKHGYTAPAVEYGHGLAHKFVAKSPELALSDGRRVLVTSAPHKFLAPAAYDIAVAFRNMLNVYRTAVGVEPAMSLHTIRFVVGSDSYANGTAETRAKSYANMPRHIDGELVRGSVLIFVDDVRITGSTEERFADLVLPHNPYALCTLLAAQVDSVQAAAEPTIENTMNKWRFPTLDALAEDIATGAYRLNSRALRTILEHGDTDPDALMQFFEGLSDEFLGEMLVALMSGTREMWNRLPNGRNILIQTCLERRLPLAEALDEISLATH